MNKTLNKTDTISLEKSVYIRMISKVTWNFFVLLLILLSHTVHESPWGEYSSEPLKF